MCKTIWFCFEKAHEILWKLGHWRYLAAPVVITFFLLPVMLGILYLVSAWLLGYFEDGIPGVNMPPWLMAFVLVFVVITGFGGPFWVLYRSLVMFCYSPFLNRLSIAAERSVAGQIKSADSGAGSSLRRALLMTVTATLLSVAVMAMGVLLNLIPLLGTILFLLVVPPIQMFLGTLAYVDPYLKRNGFGFAASIKLMAKNVLPMTIFGATGFAIMTIPVVGWFVGPTYSVVAGIVFGMLLVGERQEKTLTKATEAVIAE